MKVSPLTSLRTRTLAVSGLAILIATLSAFPTSRALGRDNAEGCDTCTSRTGPEVPANYNARFDGSFMSEVASLGIAGKRTAASETELAAEAKLAASVSNLHVERDEVTQLPVMVLSRAPGVVLEHVSAKSTANAEQTARNFLRTNRALYALSDEDLTTLEARYTTSPEGGATIVKFDQVAGGIPVFDAEMAVVLTKDRDVVATSGRIYSGLPTVAAASRFALPEADGIVRAIRDLTGRELSPADFAFVANGDGGYKKFEYTPDRTGSAPKFLGELVRTKQVLYPLGEGAAIPAYYLELWIDGEPAGSGPVFSYVISAEDGRILFRNNLTQTDAFNYRVYADTSAPFRPWDGPTGTIGTPHPTGSPNGFQASFVSANLVSVESLLGPSDPWLPSAAIATTGNNTDAYLDLATPDGFGSGDVRGAVTATQTFDYQYNSALAAEDANNRQAAVVGMFFQVNWLHDIWYQHGFTEAAGNAQTDNYGRGGAANDSLRAEGQDRSGTDNANMSTPADGGRPRMQMYKFLAGGRLNPTRDGTFDMLIVAHEMGHYISNRLIGNASGLNNQQGGSMGEGWGDFFCVLVTAQSTDNLDGTYAVGGQTDLQACNGFVDNYYYSIRRYPYSSDKTKSPLTFKDIGSGITTYPGVTGNPCFGSLTSSPSEVHNSGEIWAEMLWECYVALAKTYGQQVGHDKVLQYVIDGMKATPTNPTFTQARDAIIAATNGANAYANPKDAQLLWRAFAKRGIGPAAVSPPAGSGTHAGVVQDFSAASVLPDDTIGIYTNGNFFERDVLLGGSADTVFTYGGGGALVPLMGKWTGGAADTPGLYDPATGVFFLRNTNSSGPADITLSFGGGGTLVPIAGDWNGDNVDSIGLYDPVTGNFFLRNANTPGPADVVFGFGPGGVGWVPVAGDWNGDGIDTVALYDPSSGFFFVRNANAAGPADIVFSFGAGGTAIPIAGDWNSDGTDTIGIYEPTTGVFFLRNANSPGGADDIISFGPAGPITPLHGNFDGQ
jgi:hypothetical protein